MVRSCKFLPDRRMAFFYTCIFVKIVYVSDSVKNDMLFVIMNLIWNDDHYTMGNLNPLSFF